jgi:hypothetical protein
MWGVCVPYRESLVFKFPIQVARPSLKRPKGGPRKPRLPKWLHDRLRYSHTDDVCRQWIIGTGAGSGDEKLLNSGCHNAIQSPSGRCLLDIFYPFRCVWLFKCQFNQASHLKTSSSAGLPFHIKRRLLVRLFTNILAKKMLPDGTECNDKVVHSERHQGWLLHS